MKAHKQALDLELPRSPWDIPDHMLRDNGTMICQMWVKRRKGYGLDVQWGPYGFQKTFLPHQDPYTGKDCRACRHLVKTAAQAALMRRKFELQILGLFALKMSETGEIKMTPVRP